MSVISKAIQIKRAKVVKFPEPEGFEGTLYPFQKKGVAFAAITRRSINADGCGLGKTIQALAYFLWLKNKGLANHAVVLCPPSALDQWVEETRRFCPQLTAAHIRTSYAKRRYVLSNFPDVLVMHYPLLVRRPHMLDNYPYDILIADEASIWRNVETKTRRAVDYMASQVRYFIPMTATPIQTNLKDLWSLMDVARPGLLPSLPEFMAAYMDVEIRRISRGGRSFEVEDVKSYRNLKELRRIVTPFVMRRKVSDVEQDLPEIVFQPETVEMVKRHQTEYRRLAFGSGANIMMLQQFLHHAHIGRATYTPKQDRVIELLSGELRGEKVVIFSWFKAPIARLSRALNSVYLDIGRGIKHEIVTGDNIDGRHEAIRRWRENEDVPVLIGTAAIEMALNLQAARYLIMLDIFTNPKRMEQLIGRLRRINSEHSTVVVKPVLCADTHEARLFALARDREALSIFMMHDDKSSVFPGLTIDHVRKMLEGQM